ncbi:putative mitochondrial protein, conserved [Orbilia oligospora]|nr:putative mitochondrial protein, conserved [Orbilia oligospora]
MLRHILHQTRHFTTTLPFKSSKSSFKPSPSPPRLPKEDQETFESLTKASMGAFSTSHLQSPSPNTTAQSTSNSTTTSKNNITNMKAEDLLSELKHKDLLTGGEKPLFEGERNPITGEVGGPKTEPTKYGDWSFNGRVTDF